MLGWSEVLLIAVLVLVLFGAKRIPELARSLGHAKAEFKKAQNEVLKERDDFLADPSEKTSKASVAKTAVTKEQSAQPDNQIKS